MAENQQPELDLEANRNEMFHTHFIEHIERGHARRLKEGIQEFLQVYHHFNTNEINQLKEFRESITSGFEDTNVDLSRATQDMLSTDRRLKRDSHPRHIRKHLEEEVKMCKKAIRWSLKMHWLQVKQYEIINYYIVDCRSLNVS